MALVQPLADGITLRGAVVALPTLEAEREREREKWKVLEIGRRRGEGI